MSLLCRQTMGRSGSYRYWKLDKLYEQDIHLCMLDVGVCANLEDYAPIQEINCVEINQIPFSGYDALSWHVHLLPRPRTTGKLNGPERASFR